MRKHTVSILCMLCTERLSATAETPADAERLLRELAWERCWVTHKRVARHPADICPECVTHLRSVTLAESPRELVPAAKEHG